MTTNKYQSALRFYLLATQLKYRIRGGWDEDHWNVSAKRRESIAEHIYGTCILAISIDSEFELNLNIDRVLKTLVVHEIGEIIIGDITPYDGITVAEKLAVEREAIEKILSGLVKYEEYMTLLDDFIEQRNEEAMFAYLCDKLEADIQAKVYQDLACFASLDQQFNNVVFKSEKVKQAIKNGAKTAFDVWYHCDKPLYSNNPAFSKFLDYIRDNNTQAAKFTT